MDWEGLFGRSAPLCVEIGFGNGEFLTREARSRPGENFVGLELNWGSLRRALRRVAQGGIFNVRLFQIDASLAVERLFLPESIDSLCALFPCPWPKKRHAGHRLFSGSFLRLVNSRLRPGGEVRVVTDHADYAAWVLEQVCASGFDAWVSLIPAAAATKYARKWMEGGVARFYEIRLRKHGHVEVPFPEDTELKTHRIVDFHPERFEPADERGEITVAFKEFLFDPKRSKGMVRVVTAEEGLTQEFWIEIESGKRGWSIRPAPGCGVVPTAGVQRALDRVLEAALSGDPKSS
jgi:tRNA (guanine-N7-)-methyltransferase